MYRGLQKRRYLNRKYKVRDRHKGKPLRSRFELDYRFNRRKSPPETGFGVAFEHNPDAKKYRN